MKSVGRRIWRLEVHLANDAGVAKLSRPAEHTGVEQASKAVPPMFFSHDNSVNIEELVEPPPKPQKMTAVILVRLLKSQKERRCWRHDQRYTRSLNQLIEPFRRKQ